jgi:Na+-transporting NADH:ubiquinone oxidoreductase subunit B
MMHGIPGPVSQSAAGTTRAALSALLVRIWQPTRSTTRAAPYLRAPSSIDALLNSFVVASLPALLLAVWRVGWHGLTSFVPLLAVAVTVNVFWEVIFAARRDRAVDPGWWMSAWLFALLVPGATPLALVGLGASFGAVFGKHLFGGSGHYLVSPALLGLVFLRFAYPDLMSAAMVPEGGPPAAWTLAAQGGLTALNEAGITWPALVLRGALGTPSALACALGGAYLVIRGAASWRTLAGAVIAVIAATTVLGALPAADPLWQLPWHWHLVLGNFAFAVAFLATDPSTGALTRGARWMHGALIGVLVVLIRVLNPTHPEASLFAVFLAALCVPVLDQLVITLHVARTRRRSAP